MLTVFSGRGKSNCAGESRRDFLKVGALGFGAGLGGLALPDLLRLRASAAEQGGRPKNSSVIWVWLGGGPTHVETFDPKMTAPSEYRSVTGEVASSLAGVTLGGTFPKMAAVADKMALVRSFAHNNSGHGGGTHYLMTGYDNRVVDNGGVPSRPSIGSLVARLRGASHHHTGMPTYVRLGGIGSDGPAFLGPAYAPFDPAGQARSNMKLLIEQPRFEERRNLLSQIDSLRRDVDNSKLMEGLDRFEQQATHLVVKGLQSAFSTQEESPDVVKAYGQGLGAQLLTARRLCEAGCGFVTVQYGGWDMHGNIENSLKTRSPQLDQAVAALIRDLHDRGMQDDVLVVISGEFGRTPKVNKNAGRDHWAPLSTLALAGGGLRMGQVVGESADKVDVPKSKPITPQDLMATVFHVLGVPLRSQVVNSAGRPVNVIERGQPIAELV